MVSFADHCNAISLDRPSQKLNFGKINISLIILLFVSLSSPQLKRICFFSTKTHKKPHSLAIDWWEYTSNFVFQRMLRHFLNILPLKKILEFQD